MGVIEHVREIATLVKKYNDHELYEKIVALREDNIRLNEENLTLRRTVSTEAEIERVGNVSYKKSDTARKQPSCMPCWDCEGKLVNLITNISSKGQRYVTRICTICTARKSK